MKSQNTPWPQRLSADAFHGLAGKVVRLIEPQSESDPAALLIQFLTLFGNCCGAKPHFKVEATKHHTNLFSLIVGQTSRSRKGTGFDHVRAIFPEASLTTGLSSGEGLIWAARDGDRKEGDSVRDKRLIIHEPEFSRVLRTQRRDGNTLSATLRSAWDGTVLQILTRNAPVKATGAHVSIVGHITEDELRRELFATDQANGYANRFLFVCARRSKKLPEGGHVDENALAALAGRVKRAKMFARDVEEVTRSERARKMWARWYGRLNELPGMIGAITARAEAQVTRISLIYALLDEKKIVRTQHLKAALAVWRYCEDSARHIFKSVVGDKDADRIYQALLTAGKKGLTRTEIRELFSRNLDNEQASRALRLLAENRFAHSKNEKTTGGRPAERWFAR